MLKSKIVKFLKSTTAKVMSVIIFLFFVASVFLFLDWYKEQVNKIRGFYYVYQGDKYYKKGDPQNAIYSYDRALKLYPRHYRARYNLANIYVSYEDYYSAIDSYEKALEIKPNLINARIDYAIVLAEAMFDYDKAIEEYEKTIKTNPGWVYIPFIVNTKNTYKYNKGVAYYNLGLAWRGKSLLIGERTFKSREYLENAVKAYENALKIKKTYEGYYNLAIVYHLLSMYNKAGYNYCKAIEMEPMNYEAHYNLAILLKQMKNYTDSIKEFKKAGLILDTNNDTVKTQYIYGMLNDTSHLMSTTGDFESLVEHLNEQNLEDEKHLTYINGKVVITEEFDRAIAKNFQNCANKKFFIENKDELDIR